MDLPRNHPLPFLQTVFKPQDPLCLTDITPTKGKIHVKSRFRE